MGSHLHSAEIFSWCLINIAGYSVKSQGNRPVTLRGCLHNLSPNTWISHRPKWPKLPRIEIAGFLNRTRRIFMWLNTDGPCPLHQRPTLGDIVWDLSIMNKPISSATGPCTKNFGMTITICYWDAQARKLQRFATLNRIWWYLESLYPSGRGKTGTYLQTTLIFTERIEPDWPTSKEGLVKLRFEIRKLEIAK